MKENEKRAIEEMAKVLGDTWICDLKGNPHDLSEVLWDCDIKHIAEQLYERGYRKQIEAEWIVDGDERIRRAKCSNCKHEFAVQKGMLQLHRFPHCPNCGAHMKGGAE